MCFTQKYIENAAAAVKQCMGVCLKQRKHVTLTQNIGKMVKKTNYDTYTIGKYEHKNISDWNNMSS